MTPGISQHLDAISGDDPEPNEMETKPHRIPLAVYVGWATTVLTLLALGAYTYGVAMTKLDQHGIAIDKLSRSTERTEKNVDRIMGKLGISDSRGGE